MKLAQTAITKNVSTLLQKRQKKGQNELNLGSKRKPFFKKTKKTLFSEHIVITSENNELVKHAK